MIQDQLQGLILPPQETAFEATLWLGLFLLLVLVGLALWRWIKSQNSASLKAQKALESLIKNSTASTYKNTLKNNQSTAIKCSQILNAGFRVKHLDQYKPTNADQWQSFYKKLTILCYSNDPNIELYPVLQEAKMFLQAANVADK